MNLNKFIDDLVNTEAYSYSKVNKSEWLKDEELISMYDQTTGPHKSPDPVECWILYNLAKLSDGNIFEVGSWKGRSSSFMAKGIVDSGMSSNRRLYCLDWFQGDKTCGSDPDRSAMEDSLNKFGLTSLVTIYDENMLEFDYSKLSNIGLMFYDADHNTEPTVSVLNKVHPYLNETCILAAHDANWGMTADALRKVEDKFKKLKTLQVWQGFALLIKK